MKKNYKLTLISNIVCVVLLLVLFATQFLPFWSCTGCKNHEDGMISISEYLWHTDDHTPVTKGMTQIYQNYFGEDIKDKDGKVWKFEANDVVTIPLVIVITVILSVVLIVLKPKTLLPTVVACIGGVAGVVGYMTNLALEFGQNWVLHLAAAGVVTVVSAVFLIIAAYKFVRKYI